ncbi:unnamed protein product [Dovyalis caffra]|uniref:Ribosomal protein S14 n=1 Tax=Dovyalis caffra TaxID=77055 RepID=A0AAV1STC5_9ROSI|nr:unnamed protein product [Dovyalis caffra]
MYGRNLKSESCILKQAYQRQQKQRFSFRLCPPASTAFGAKAKTQKARKDGPRALIARTSTATGKQAEAVRNRIMIHANYKLLSSKE